MARAETMVQLTDELVRLLDDEARRRGVSRSALIREVLTDHLASSTELAITQAIVDGYTRVPPATPDEWGNLERESDLAAAEVGQRLDAEERAAGHEPW